MPTGRTERVSPLLRRNKETASWALPLSCSRIDVGSLQFCSEPGYTPGWQVYHI